MQMREQVGQSRNTVFFQCLVSQEGRKRGEMRDQKLHAWPSQLEGRSVNNMSMEKNMLKFPWDFPAMNLYLLKISHCHVS